MTPDTTTPTAETTTQTPQTPAVDQQKEAPVKRQATLEHFSDEQINKRVQENLDRWLKGDLKPKPEPEEKAEEVADSKAEKKPEEAKAEDVSGDAKKKAKTAEPEEASDDTEKEPEPKPRRRKRQVDPEEESTRFDKAVEKLADKLSTPKETPKEAGLSKADTEKRRVFEQMAKDNPEEYAGLPEKFEKFVSQESKYRQKWEKENPGERYNPEDEAHSEFYDKYGIEYDNDAYVDARVELKANERLENFTKRQQEQQEKQRREQEASQQIERITADVPKLLAKEIVGKEIDLDALESEDPVAHTFISRAMNDANTLVSELARLVADPSKLDLKGNPTHGVLMERLEYYESQLSELPFEKAVIKEGGRTKEFATLDDFQRMSAADKKHYWTVYTHPEQTKKYILKDLGAVVKSDIERQEQLFQQRLAKRNGGSSQTQTSKESSKPQPRRDSPDISGGDRKVPPVDTGAPKQSDSVSLMDKWLMGA